MTACESGRLQAVRGEYADTPRGIKPFGSNDARVLKSCDISPSPPIGSQPGLDRYGRVYTVRNVYELYTRKDGEILI